MQNNNYINLIPSLYPLQIYIPIGFSLEIDPEGSLSFGLGPTHDFSSFHTIKPPLLQNSKVGSNEIGAQSQGGLASISNVAVSHTETCALNVIPVSSTTPEEKDFSTFYNANDIQTLNATLDYPLSSSLRATSGLFSSSDPPAVPVINNFLSDDHCFLARPLYSGCDGRKLSGGDDDAAKISVVVKNFVTQTPESYAESNQGRLDLSTKQTGLLTYYVSENDFLRKQVWAENTDFKYTQTHILIYGNLCEDEDRLLLRRKLHPGESLHNRTPVDEKKRSTEAKFGITSLRGVALLTLTDKLSLLSADLATCRAELADAKRTSRELATAVATAAFVQPQQQHQLPPSCQSDLLSSNCFDQSKSANFSSFPSALMPTAVPNRDCPLYGCHLSADRDLLTQLSFAGSLNSPGFERPRSSGTNLATITLAASDICVSSEVEKRHPTLRKPRCYTSDP
ncbi:unnamed protein product [Protopolystoma xenopodis]|uniref:Uncharacterized protein n=1 Tax=Protopolystoma xenopodis TaxID=117903 RepID=A0A3S5FBP1_9PLAT|nr:unnamed protein product [Protopolystoma xenopodis]